MWTESTAFKLVCRRLRAAWKEPGILLIDNHNKSQYAWFMYRHGDLLIKRVTEFEGKRVIKKWLPEEDRVTLLRGEATGHSHVLKANEGSRISLYENEVGDRFFEVKGTAVLLHEEHKTIELPEGSYRVIRQRVYTPKAIEYVRD